LSEASSITIISTNTLYIQASSAAAGLVRVSSLGHTHLHDLDFLLLGRSDLPDGSCGYDAIFQFFSPQVYISASLSTLLHD
jgi:hypothetical protein